MVFKVTIKPEGSNRVRFQKNVTAKNRSECKEFVEKAVLPTLGLKKPVVSIR